MCFIFIDESGDLGVRGSKYLVLAALFIQDTKPLHRIVKNMRRYQFKKELKKACEIKANKSSDKVRLHMIEKLNMVHEAKVFYVVLEKKKLYSQYLRNDKHKLYNFVAGKLAKNIILEDLDVEVIIDRSKGKQLLQADFNTYFLKNLEKNSRHRKATICHGYSHNFEGLQFADLLAWSCFQKFEHENPLYVESITIPQEVYYVW